MKGCKFIYHNILDHETHSQYELAQILVLDDNLDAPGNEITQLQNANHITNVYFKRHRRGKTSITSDQLKIEKYTP